MLNQPGELIDREKEEEGRGIGWGQQTEIHSPARETNRTDRGFEDEETQVRGYICGMSHMSARGKEMCSRGGKARAARMTAEEHSAHGKKMIAARRRKEQEHEEWLAAWIQNQKNKEKEEVRVISRRDFERL